MKHRPEFTFVDLFAGCGGLSLGLVAAGFRLGFAVEKSPMAAETFLHNLISGRTSRKAYGPVAANESDICGINAPLVEQIRSGLLVGEVQDLINAIRCEPRFFKQMSQAVGRIDFLVGGPPCQGFSTAGLRDANDERNVLPNHFLELVKIFSPPAVLMENVVGMRRQFNEIAEKDEAAYHSVSRELEQCGEPGYVVQELCLNAKHYGVPQHRPRLMLFAIRKDFAAILGLQSTGKLWRSEDYFGGNLGGGLCPAPSVKGIADFRTVGDALSCLDETAGIPSSYVEEINDKHGLARHLTDRKFRRPPNHEKRKHSSRVRSRFQLHHYFKENSVPPRIFKVASSFGELQSAVTRETLMEMLEGAKIPAVCPNGEVLASTENQLLDFLVAHASKKHSQRPLDLEKPAPTVMSIPDDFIHPIEPRTMTVREQARLQSFPDLFEFKSKPTTGGKMRREQVPQYTQVGNAVPPLMAMAIGIHVKRILGSAQGAVESFDQRKESSA